MEAEQRESARRVAEIRSRLRVREVSDEEERLLVKEFLNIRVDIRVADSVEEIPREAARLFRRIVRDPNDNQRRMSVTFSESHTIAKMVRNLVVHDQPLTIYSSVVLVSDRATDIVAGMVGAEFLRDEEFRPQVEALSYLLPTGIETLIGANSRERKKKLREFLNEKLFSKAAQADFFWFGIGTLEGGSFHSHVLDIDRFVEDQEEEHREKRGERRRGAGEARDAGRGHVLARRLEGTTHLRQAKALAELRRRWLVADRRRGSGGLLRSDLYDAVGHAEPEPETGCCGWRAGQRRSDLLRAQEAQVTSARSLSRDRRGHLAVLGSEVSRT